MQKITIQKPDDFHCHLRDGVILKEAVRASSRSFHRVLAMPNLTPPVTTAKDAMNYKSRILEALPEGSLIDPIVTLFLTDKTTHEDIKTASSEGVLASKLYPAGVTTNSDSAVNSIETLYPIFEEMSKVGMLLLIHGEVNDHGVDIFDREAVFIEKYLQKIVKNFPDLKIVFEHISTKEAVDFVNSASEKVAATITPQHLHFNRNDLLVGGVKPHNYCLPILKRSTHQQALIEAIKTGSKKFFLGTDSAPHLKGRKESSCGCAGCYTAPVALELYAQVFEEAGVLDKLEGFASHYGSDFYGLSRNTETITLIKKEWTVPSSILLENKEVITPFLAGEELSWQILA